MIKLQREKGTGPMINKRTRDMHVDGAAGGGRGSWWRVVLIMVLGVSLVGLTGCLGSDGRTGPPGEPGAPAPPVGAPVPPGNVLPSVTITDAYIRNGRPVVEFQVTAQLDSGFGVTFEPSPGDVEFTIARLVRKDDYQTWQSYLNTVAGGPRTGPHARLQADQVRGNHAEGVWESLGGNAYRYTYPVNVNEVPAEYLNGVEPVTAADWVAASQIDMRRFVVLVRPGSNWEAAYDYKDVGQGETKRAVATASCNSCHDNLSAHGNNRIGTETCSNCHNQFNFSSFTDSPNAVDLAYLGHEIHSGGGLAGSQQFLRPRWTGVAFPRDIATCVSCHDSSHAGSGAARAFTKPTIEACSSCHDNVNFATGAGHAAGPRDNASCAGCHTPDTPPPFAGSETLVEAHQNAGRQFARDGNLRYVIDSVERVGNQLTVRWGVEYDGSRVVHQEDGWVLSAAIRVGAFGTDFTHSDPDQARPGAPVEQSNAQNSATQSGGTYTSTIDLAGKGITGTVYVTLGGNVNSADFSALVASNAIRVVGGQPRRQVVSMATCTTCHEDRVGVFNKHGGNRHNDVQQCILCHNNNSTDIDRRELNPRPYIDLPHPDGQREQATNFMVMVHGLHSTAAGFRRDDLWITGFGSWSHWDSGSSFPGNIANCTQCHDGNTYYPVSRELEPRGTTVDSLGGSSNVDAHWKVSAAMAACSSCHDSTGAQVHMTQNGGVSGDPWNQPTIDASSFETCSTCHGPGRVADVRTVHGLRN